MSETSEIRHPVFIRAPREKVWAAFTTPQDLDVTRISYHQERS